MLKELGGYSIESLLQRGSVTNIYLANDKTGKKVILKTLVDKHPSPRHISQFRHEYEITKDLSVDGIRKVHKYLNQNNQHLLLMDYFEGKSLRDCLDKRKIFTVKNFLELALKLSRIVQIVHDNDIIHKDIEPDNILVDDSFHQLQLIDFGLSSKISLKQQSFSPTNTLEGTIAYLSPEQTGRMNRIVDNRSDLYSLGVTFYEMITGQLPFSARDSMEMVHHHIAQKPPDPHLVNPNIPQLLSDIILKLLEKNAEDRYQSAFGLKNDLERCLNDLKASNGQVSLPKFDLGQDDYSGKFQISEKLYGREKEIKLLMRSFKKIAKGETKLMLVSGYSGVGKSSLVNEIYKPITGRRGHFISGKYNQYQKDVPYSAFLQAFEEFANYLLKEEEVVLERWRGKLQQRVGANGKILTDVVPSLELIIGSQPDVTPLSGKEAQSRFNNIMKGFIEIVSQEVHPLVVFIDDLQWTDPASLELLEVIFSDTNIGHLLVIVAFRDNEMPATHPFVSTLEKIRFTTDVVEIKLGNLSLPHVNELISETLQSEDTYSLPLTNLVYQKTQGNAFFTKEFLKSLFEEGMLRLSGKMSVGKKQQWEWDIDTITQMNITDNVVELMSGKIKRLPISAQKALKLASCIGNRFHIFDLAVICEDDTNKTANALHSALFEGLIIPVGEDYKLAYFEEVNVEYRFTHDRIQQAVYQLIPEKDRNQQHLNIGRLLLDNIAIADQNDHIFDIVNQYNQGIALIDDELEKLTLSQLNYKAGLKAKLSSAHNAALKHFITADNLLPDNTWDAEHEFTWSVYFEKAAAQYSCVQLEVSEDTINFALPRSKKKTQKIKLYKIYLNVLFQLNRHEDGIQIMRDALAVLGVRIPKKVRKIHIAKEFIKFRIGLGKRHPDELLSLPELNNEHVYNIISTIYDSVPSTYMISGDTMAYISILMANYCLKYGNSVLAPFAYCMTATVYVGLLKSYSAGYQLCDMAIRLNEKMPGLDTKARVYFLTANFPLHYVKPVREYKPMIETALHCALDAGSLNWADYSIAFSRAQSILFNNATLGEIAQENIDYYAINLDNKDQEVCKNQYFLLKFIERLRGDQQDQVENIYDFDMDSYHTEMSKLGNIVIRIYFFTFNTLSEYSNGNYLKALDYAKEGNKIMDDSLGIMSDCVFRFYYLLTVLACRQQLTTTQKIKLSIPYQKNKLLLHHFAKKCPENFSCHYLLFLAEEAKSQGKSMKCIQLYTQAISAAEESNFTQMIALCNELYGKYWLEMNNNKLGSIYLNEAKYFYYLWGAHSKVKQLEENYYLILSSFTQSSRTDLELSVTSFPSISSTTSTGSDKPSLDMISLLKASYAISQQVHLKELIEELTSIFSENAGAESSVLIQNSNGKWMIHDEDNDSGFDDEVLFVPIEKSELVPHSVIQYVERSKKPLVLGNASSNTSFNTDPYIASAKTKSVLCFPIIRESEISFIIYLENNLSTKVFTDDRMQVLQLLSAQIGVSIENALMYGNLEQKVAERTHEVVQQNEELEVQKNNLEKARQTIEHQNQKLLDTNEMLEIKVQQRTKELEEAYQNLLNAHKQLDHFTYRSGHDLNGPIARLMGLCHLAKLEVKDVKSIKYFNLLEQQAFEMKHLISRLIRTHEIKSKEVVSEKINLQKVVDEIIGFYQQKEVTKNIVFNVEIQKSIIYMSDILLTKTLLENVIENAVAFRNTTEAINVIDVKIEAIENHQLSIDIKDYGIGIDADIAPKIFDMFVVGTERSKGAGLGLYEANMIVNKLNGKIWLEDFGKGHAEFRVILPLTVHSIEAG